MTVCDEIAPHIETDQVRRVLFQPVEMGEVIVGEGEGLQAGEKGHVEEGLDLVGGEIEVSMEWEGVVKGVARWYGEGFKWRCGVKDVEQRAEGENIEGGTWLN